VSVLLNVGIPNLIKPVGCFPTLLMPVIFRVGSFDGRKIFPAIVKKRAHEKRP